MSGMNQESLKYAMRKLAKQKRAGFHKDLPDASFDIVSNFPVPFGENTIVASYIAVQNEIDPTPIMKELSDKGVTLCLPRINKITNSLNFHEYNFGDELIQGSFGIFEPSSTAKLVYPNIMLVPLLAFDNNGFRLGYGGGYYDRAIKAAKSKCELITIGLAYSGQKVETIPVEPHDQALDFVITDKICYDFRCEKV